MHRRDFHRAGNGRCARIERAAEDNRFGQWPALHLAALRAHVPEGFPALDWRARKSAAAAPSVEPASASTPCRQTSREKISAPSMTSSNVRADVCCAKRALYTSISSAALIDNAGQIGHPNMFRPQAQIDQ